MPGVLATNSSSVMSSEVNRQWHWIGQNALPGKVSGAWLFRGTRIPVAAVFENLEDGLSMDEVVALYDGR